MYAQGKNSWAKENIQFTGYVKYLNTSQFQDLNVIVSDNLIHNRLNLKVFLNNQFTFDLEVRNQVIWGNSLQLIPKYAQTIDTPQDIDLSGFIVKEKGLLFHLKVDRLHIDFQSEKWHITLGRQRINWGKNLVWNPNDLFNAYSFFDFDYEERPGADALRVQYYTSGDSGLEVAINYTKDWEDNTLAVKYNFNRYDYDFQIMAAKYFADYMLGVGWEGALKNIGFKGEMSYFTPKEQTDDDKEVFVGAISFDYYFKNGITINASGLYNSSGVSSALDFDLTQFNRFNLSAKQFMPNKTSYFIQVSKMITPAFTSSLATIYAQELNGIFLMPQMSYSLAQNWEFDTTAQILYGKQAASYTNLMNSVFLRFRWSF
jgi:hypothetical protein